MRVGGAGTVGKKNPPERRDRPCEGRCRIPADWRSIRGERIFSGRGHIADAVEGIGTVGGDGVFIDGEVTG
jgi:hypothetical protein